MCFDWQAASMTKIYLVRHGETQLNQKGCYYGWTDCGLSEKGVQEAQCLGKSFERIKYDAIISSDLKRAFETAEILNTKKGPILEDKRLRELNFGLWEGLNHEQLQELYKEQWDRWTADWINTAPTEGESFLELYQRVTECMEELLNKYKDQTIVVVSHKGVLQIITTVLLKLPMDRIWCFSFEHGKYSLLEFHNDHGTILGLNNR